ncbi:MAG: tRNA lysidine(34) synthetase TilS [Bacteroidales bacterium]|nr:tRNA lysidine(34) synthetase TilS [Bacteroidales bacterium]
MIKQLNDYITARNIPDNRNPVIVGVSGGIDSMVLLHLMQLSGYQITAAHCNFSLRGKESDGDQQFVTEKCARAAIPLRTVRFDTSEYAREMGISIQMAARDLRFIWFRKLANELDISYIALAHNRNDIAETLLINMLRGTGLAGLTGIRPVNGNIIRPLLFATRDMIENYATDNNILFREDSSNSDTKYIRNRIRHIVLPAMEEISDGTVSRLAETAERLTGSYDILLSETGKKYDQIFSQRDKLIYASRIELLSLEPLETYIFELFRRFGISSQQINGVINLLKSPSGKVINTSSHRILADRKNIIIKPRYENEAEQMVVESEEALLSVTSHFKAEKVEPAYFNPSSDSSVAWIDADKIKYPLSIRRWIPGDTFQPFGMGGRSKKVSDLLTDHKLSLFQKEKVSLLVSGGEVVWVIGIRADYRYRITAETTSLIKLTSRSRIII